MCFKNAWLYPFDAEKDASEKWEETRKKVEEEFERGQISRLC